MEIEELLLAITVESLDTSQEIAELQESNDPEADLMSNIQNLMLFRRRDSRGGRRDSSRRDDRDSRRKRSRSGSYEKKVLDLV